MRRLFDCKNAENTCKNAIFQLINADFNGFLDFPLILFYKIYTKTKKYVIII